MEGANLGQLEHLVAGQDELVKGIDGGPCRGRVGARWVGKHLRKRAWTSQRKKRVCIADIGV